MTTVCIVQSSHTDLDVLIPIGEVAKLLGVTVQTVRRWDKDGRLAAVRTPAGHRRYRRDEISALLGTEAASA